jgi:hypothetical protein
LPPLYFTGSNPVPEAITKGRLPWTSMITNDNDGRIRNNADEFLNH